MAPEIGLWALGEASSSEGHHGAGATLPSYGALPWDDSGEDRARPAQQEIPWLAGGEAREWLGREKRGQCLWLHSLTPPQPLSHQEAPKRQWKNRGNRTLWQVQGAGEGHTLCPCAAPHLVGHSSFPHCMGAGAEGPGTPLT